MKPLHFALAFVAAVSSVGAAALDWRAPRSAHHPAVAASDYISAPDLAERIVRGEPSLFIRDLRSPEEFDRFHVPTAQPATLESLAREPTPAGATFVIYADDEQRVAEAWAWLRHRGQIQVLVLRQGLYEWIGRVLEPRLAADATMQERAQFERSARLSRFFGGVPRASVERRDVPIGYWNGGASQRALAEATRNAVAAVRRRGC